MKTGLFFVCALLLHATSTSTIIYSGRRCSNVSCDTPNATQSGLCSDGECTELESGKCCSNHDIYSQTAASTTGVCVSTYIYIILVCSLLLK